MSLDMLFSLVTQSFVIDKSDTYCGCILHLVLSSSESLIHQREL